MKKELIKSICEQAMNKEVFTTREIGDLFSYITPKVLDNLKDTNTIESITERHKKPAKFDYVNTLYAGFLDALSTVLKGKSILLLAKSFPIEKLKSTYKVNQNSYMGDSGEICYDTRAHYTDIVLFNTYLYISFTDRESFVDMFTNDEIAKIINPEYDKCISLVDDTKILETFTKCLNRFNNFSGVIIKPPFYSVAIYKIEEKIQKYIDERNSKLISDCLHEQKSPALTG